MQRKLDELRALADEVKALRGRSWRPGAAPSSPPWPPTAPSWRRVDGFAPNELRELALAVRDQPGVDIVVLVGETTTGGVGIAAAVKPGLGIEAAGLIRDAAKAVGGGGGKGDVATAGGKDTSGIDDALRIAKDAVVSAARRPDPCALGFDLGSKRIGVAVSDRSGTIASPLTVIGRGRSRREDHRRIAALAREEEVELVVVGLPLQPVRRRRGRARVLGPKSRRWLPWSGCPSRPTTSGSRP